MGSQLPCRVTWLLEFSGAPQLEQAWLDYRAARTYLGSDAAVLGINALANATVLLRLRMLADLPLSSRIGLVLNLLLSIAHAALKLGEVGLAGYGVAGIGALLTSLLLESFMRVWLALVLLLLSSVLFVMLED
ncbi:hypothetical protein OEZ86_006427 [Tetradesmus obliquus]|nr:hypothetical protein OEZ86_006427 [Tetradesmus obliquus]